MPARTAHQADQPPKGAKGAYLFFSIPRVKAIREETGKNQREAMRQAGDEWSAMSEEAKAPFKEQAEADKVRAANEMAEFMERNPGWEKPKRSRKKNPATKSKPKKDPNAPKGAISSYLFYYKEHLRPLMASEGLDFKTARSRVTENWHALSDEDKAPYIEKANEDKARFLREMEEYEAKAPATVAEESSSEEDDSESDHVPESDSESDVPVESESEVEVESEPESVAESSGEEVVADSESEADEVSYADSDEEREESIVESGSDLE